MSVLTLTERPLGEQIKMLERGLPSSAPPGRMPGQARVTSARQAPSDSEADRTCQPAGTGRVAGQIAYWPMSLRVTIYAYSRESLTGD